MHVGCAKLHDLGDAYTCTRNPLTQWESGRPWVSRSLSWSWGHLFLISITNFLSHVFFLSLDIRINGWETKETLPAATNYSIALLPFLIHKCVKCLRNKKHIRKKKEILQRSRNLPTCWHSEAVGAYRNFLSLSLYPKV